MVLILDAVLTMVNVQRYPWSYVISTDAEYVDLYGRYDTNRKSPNDVKRIVA